MAKKTAASLEKGGKPVPIVAIGASAGGLEAVSELLRHLSPDTGMAYVYVQHLDPTHESMLSALLGKVTPMAVREAGHEMPLRPNEVYIIPPNKDMEVVDGTLVLQPRRDRPFVHMPIDRFFISLSECRKEGVIAVLLSGTGTDGTLGLKSIKLAGGITFAQNDTARFNTMPMAAIGEGVVDMVMAPDAIARELERLSRKAAVFQQINKSARDQKEEDFTANKETVSISKELETGKKETASTNEQLTAMNQELQARNDQLSEAYEYSKVIFGAIREATLMLDSHLRIRSANQAFYRTFHAKPESTEGILIYELGARRWDIPELRHLLENIIPQKGHFQDFEVRHTFPGLGEKVMLLNAKMVMQQPNRQERILLVIEDITEHKQVQRLLEEREAWFHGMADNAPVLIWVAGPDGQYNFLNKTWLQFTGRTMQEETGRGWAERIHPDDRENYRQLYNDHFKNRQPFRTEYRLMRHDGEYRWMLENGKPFFSINGEFIGYMGTCAEVHDQKLENEELEARVIQRTQALYEANINLKRSNEELRQYAYIASHDLQEPLRKIVTFSGRIRKKFADALPDQGHEYLNKIVSSAQRMTRLIDDLLTFSRTIHQNKKFVTVDLNEILREVLQDFDLTIAEKNATVRAGHLPTIEAVPLQMAQLFYNLVGNALKFTSPSKSPLISIEEEEATAEEVQQRMPQAEPGDYRKIAVRDNGIGFDPSFSEQIFSIFQRLHDRDSYMGTGIGLALCRRIINNHGGDLYAEGKEGEGAAFYILIPIKHSETVSGAAEGEAP